jgi:hypothetical protein
VADRCSFIKKDGEQCQAFSLRGFTHCLFHSDAEERKAACERCLSRDELRKVAESALKAVQHSRIPKLEKSREMRSWLQLILVLSGEAKPEPVDSLEQRIERAKSEHR